MNPGPETWQLSTCNPTGLTGKAAQFATLAPGIAAVSESHLTAQGLVQFRKELVGTKSPLQSCTVTQLRTVPMQLSPMGESRPGFVFSLRSRVEFIPRALRKTFLKPVGWLVPIFGLTENGFMEGWHMGMLT